MVNLVAAAKLFFCKIKQAIKHSIGTSTQIALAAVVLSMGLVAPAQAAQALVPQPPQLGASAYILMDALTGKVIAELNADHQYIGASPKLRWLRH